VQAWIRREQPDPEELGTRLRALERRVPEHLRTAKVLALLGETYGRGRDFEAAVRHLTAAVRKEKASLTVRQLEQLARLEARLGQAHAEAKRFAEADACFARSERRLRALIDLDGAATRERLCLLGGTLKRWGQYASLDPAERTKRLRAAADAYAEAGKVVKKSTDRIHYYPALNHALLQVALHPGEAPSTEIVALVEGARADLPGWQIDEPGLWADIAQYDIQLASALLASAEPPGSLATRLSGAYVGRLGAFSDPLERDAVKRHLAEVAALMPEGWRRALVVSIVDDVRALLGRT
jgi:hypothetical protein